MVPTRRKSFEDHWAKLDRSDPTGCWPWPLSKGTHGYGVLTVNYVTHRAHKYFYEKLVGPVPEGFVIDHLCHDPDLCSGGKNCPHRACCNPLHMQAVTSKVNILRGSGIAARNARKTHCKRGHEFTKDNTYIKATGSRVCRQCMRDHSREFERKKRIETKQGGAGAS